MREWWLPAVLVLLHVPSPTLWPKMRLRCEPPAGHVQAWAPPSSTASGGQNKWQDPSRSGVSVPGVAAGEPSSWAA